ncbi:DUF1801 domain-containing protein [Ulvibacter antarcticus]|uniref:Uncharacterized protein DUF1801 n=1 Tax=Ulvibacter antarcticus TaxID=442714 RepID=A0A3L9YBL8_9FLAO|nr:DUF1801 domain-containing protein [Ulvibacter antarcticus]RMA58066.1 uncharacterized protein DUF1801 [Ulvibacter antarcticus]
MELQSGHEVKEVFNNYPEIVRHKLLQLREIILSIASEVYGLQKLEETLKWGEPSYKTKNGSTIRIDWKEKSPNQFAMYFNCNTSLIPSFRIIYKDVFQFEGKRALLFKMDDELPRAELEHCIKMALTYHKIKHLPLLGA